MTQNKEPLDAIAFGKIQKLMGTRLAGMVGIFIDHAGKALAAMELAVEKGDGAALALHAHTQKSAAGQLGAYALQDVFAAIEKLAEEGNIAEAASEVPHAKAEFARVTSALAIFAPRP
ncbi:MAG: Hpt domain [Alphaproteobacteria bacterium]|jgi:HPt (histidine-containing phosphotransfer) domain-containing protein|nr:Hpt domain [Alphaproteobacteria bacterium]